MRLKLGEAIDTGLKTITLTNHIPQLLWYAVYCSCPYERWMEQMRLVGDCLHED